jgi:hypothetical protein
MQPQRRRRVLMTYDNPSANSFSANSLTAELDPTSAPPAGKIAKLAEAAYSYLRCGSIPYLKQR